jgi:hypothetical protein
MTRKDYVLIAEAIAGAINYETDFNNNPANAEVLKKLSISLGSVLWQDNPTRFDRARFLEACGVK